MQKRFLLLPLFLLAIMTLISGCSLIGNMDDQMNDAMDDIREKSGMSGDTGIVDRDGVTSVIVSPESVLDLRPLRISDDLPDVKVKNFSANNASLEQILMLAFSDSGLSYKVTFEGAPSQSLITSVRGFTGSIKQLLDTLSEGLGFFYTYDKVTNLVTISPQQTFAVSLPPMPDTHTSILGIVQKLGAITPILDETTSQLIFSANRSTLQQINSYLEMLRSNLSLLHYEVYIMQVALNRSGELGIKWTDFSTSNGQLTGLTGGATASPGAFSATLTFSNSNFSMKSLLNFLATQGDTETLSQPRIDAISGIPAKLNVVNKDRYISKIGVAPSVAGSAPVQTTETADLVTGLSMSVLGAYRDDTIFTTLNLSFSTGSIGQLYDLGNGKVNLPTQQERSVETKVRAKPGEVIVLSGLIQDDKSNNQTGIPFMSGIIPVGTNSNFSRKELVIIFKPTVTVYNRNAGAAIK